MKQELDAKQKRQEVDDIFTLPAELQSTLNSDAAGKLRFLDMLIAAGEEPYEYEGEVRVANNLLEPLFFGYLMRHGVDPGAEVLAEFLGQLIEFVYLGDTGARRRPLKKLSKRALKDFISLSEFAVPLEDWEQGINPFDGVLYIYNFLSELGYDVLPERAARAVLQIRREVKKTPCSIPQAGQELEQ